MTQSLLTIVVFVALILALPFLARRYQQRRHGLNASTLGPTSKVVSAMAVGPQQRRQVAQAVVQGELHLAGQPVAQQVGHPRDLAD